MASSSLTLSPQNVDSLKEILQSGRTMTDHLRVRNILKTETTELGGKINVVVHLIFAAFSGLAGLAFIATPGTFYYGIGLFTVSAIILVRMYKQYKCTQQTIKNMENTSDKLEAGVSYLKLFLAALSEEKISKKGISCCLRQINDDAYAKFARFVLESNASTKNLIIKKIQEDERSAELPEDIKTQIFEST